MNKKFKITSLALALTLVFAACTKKQNENQESTTSNEIKENTNSTSMEIVGSSEKTVQSGTVLHRSYLAPHGEDSFARVAVITSGDKIVDAIIDEYQYFDKDSEFTALPGSDGKFGEGALEGKIFGSKIENNEQYSKLMTEHAKSTVSISDNYKAITDFVKGKTISEIEQVIGSKKEDGTVDGVTGATLLDTAKYLEAIITAAQDSTFISKISADNIDDVSLNYVYGKAHGDRSFADVIVATENGKVVGASIDEFQYFGKSELPNSEKALSKNFADKENQLSSKLQSNEQYSAMMAEKAKSTKSLAENYKAIENFAIGKTSEEIKAVIDQNESGKPVDAISEATLVDTVGYLQLIFEAINK